MGQKEIWEQKSFADLDGAGKEGKEALPYYLIPKGTVVWPQKSGRIIDRYRGSLVGNVVTTPVLRGEKENKRQKREEGLLFWNLIGTSKKLSSDSLILEKGATLYFDHRYWRINSGSIIATGQKKINNIEKIKVR